jgi:hypothetical protein
MAINVSNLVVKGELQDKSAAIDSGVANLVVEKKQPKRKVFQRDQNIDSVVERFYKDSPYVRDMINN